MSPLEALLIAAAMVAATFTLWPSSDPEKPFKNWITAASFSAALAALACVSCAVRGI